MTIISSMTKWHLEKLQDFEMRLYLPLITQRRIMEIRFLVKNQQQRNLIMIIIHDFGDPSGNPNPSRYDVFVADLGDGTYSITWNLEKGFSLRMSEATLRAKSLAAQQEMALVSMSTYSKDEQFEFTDEELGLIGLIED